MAAFHWMNGHICVQTDFLNLARKTSMTLLLSVL